MRLDVLRLISGDPSWRAANGLFMKDHTMWTYLDSEQLVYIKGPNGYPWDWYTFDEQFIYLLLTEKTWSNPKTGKIQYRNGVPRMPRYIDYSPDMQGQASVNFKLAPPRTDYLIINDDGTASASSNGNVSCSFSGPYPGAAILDSKGSVIIPAGDDWRSDYNRAGALERLTHRDPVGRYQWEQFDSNGKLTFSSYASAITVQACPNPVQQLW